MAMPEGLMELLLKAGGEDEKYQLSHDVQIVRLKEAVQRYIRPNPFKILDLVTPIAEASTKGTGEPHIVCEVRDGSVASFVAGGDPGSSSYGKHHDMRVLSIPREGNTVFSHWVESAEFEFYVPPKE